MHCHLYFGNMIGMFVNKHSNFFYLELSVSVILVYSWLDKQVKGLEKFMAEKGYKTIDQMLGIATDACLEYADMPH